MKRKPKRRIRKAVTTSIMIRISKARTSYPVKYLVNSLDRRFRLGLINPRPIDWPTLSYGISRWLGNHKSLKRRTQIRLSNFKDGRIKR